MCCASCPTDYRSTTVCWDQYVSFDGWVSRLSLKRVRRVSILQPRNNWRVCLVGGEPLLTSNQPIEKPSTFSVWCPFKTCTLVDKQPNHRARQSTAAEEPAESPEGKTDLGCDGNTPDSSTDEWSTHAVSKPACHPSSCLGHGLASTRTQPIHSRTQWLTLSPSFNALNMIHGVSLMLCTTFRKRATYVLTTVMQMELQEQ